MNGTPPLLLKDKTPYICRRFVTSLCILIDLHADLSGYDRLIHINAFYFSLKHHWNKRDRV